MKRIGIILFSGTGMTEYVIRQIAQELEKNAASVVVYPLERTQIADIPFSEYDSIGIAYPVHAFNAPKIVINFARKMPVIENKRVFLISTAGEDHPVNYFSSSLLIMVLQEKQYHVFYDRQLYMPANFAVKYNDSKVEQLISTVDASIPEIANDIIHQTERKQRGRFLSDCMAVLGRAEWFGAIWIGKLFYTNQNCNHCGLCSRRCPSQNITCGEKVSFHWRCGLCMRCQYICPQQAINVRWPFRFIRLDEWYTNEKLPFGKRPRS